MPAPRCSSVSHLVDKSSLRRTELSSSCPKNESTTKATKEILTSQSQPDLRKYPQIKRETSEKDAKKKVLKVKKKKKIVLLANLALTKYSLGRYIVVYLYYWICH